MASICKQYATGRVGLYGHLWHRRQVHMTGLHGNPLLSIRQIGSYFHPEEYQLADKAYALERHIIMPYEEPTTRQSPFNYSLSN